MSCNAVFDVWMCGPNVPFSAAAQMGLSVAISASCICSYDCVILSVMSSASKSASERFRFWVVPGVLSEISSLVWLACRVNRALEGFILLSPDSVVAQR